MFMMLCGAHSSSASSLRARTSSRGGMMSRTPFGCTPNHGKSIMVATSRCSSHWEQVPPYAYPASYAIVIGSTINPKFDKSWKVVGLAKSTPSEQFEVFNRTKPRGLSHYPRMPYRPVFCKKNKLTMYDDDCQTKKVKKSSPYKNKSKKMTYKKMTKVVKAMNKKTNKSQTSYRKNKKGYHAVQPCSMKKQTKESEVMKTGKCGQVSTACKKRAVDEKKINARMKKVGQKPYKLTFGKKPIVKLSHKQLCDRIDSYITHSTKILQSEIHCITELPNIEIRRIQIQVEHWKQRLSEAIAKETSKRLRFDRLYPDDHPRLRRRMAYCCAGTRTQTATKQEPVNVSDVDEEDSYHSGVEETKDVDSAYQDSAFDPFPNDIMRPTPMRLPSPDLMTPVGLRDSLHDVSAVERVREQAERQEQALRSTIRDMREKLQEEKELSFTKKKESPKVKDDRVPHKGHQERPDPEDKRSVSIAARATRKGEASYTLPWFARTPTGKSVYPDDYDFFPSSDSSDSSDSSSDSSKDDDSDNSSKHKSDKKKKKKTTSSKKKKRSTESIFKALMRTSKSYDVPTLQYHVARNRRRGVFNHFLDKLQFVTSSIKETKNVLALITEPRRAKTRSADKALFRFLCAKADEHTKNQLKDLQLQLRAEKGFEALMLLKELYSVKGDKDFQRKAYRELTTLKYKTGPILEFNKLFTKKYRNLVGSGIEIPEFERVDMYIQAMKTHKDPMILYHVIKFENAIETDPYAKGLTEVQNFLVKEDDKSHEQDQEPDTPKGYRSQSGSRRKSSANNATKTNRRKSNAHAAKKKYNRPLPPDLKCHGCGGNHLLKDCPTTTAAQKKEIWDRINASKQAFVPQKSANKATATTKDKKQPVSKPKPSTSEDKPKKEVAFAQAQMAARRTATCSMAMVDRRLAYCSGASSLVNTEEDKRPMPNEGNVQDPHSLVNPPVSAGEVVRNERAKIVLYDEQVLIDSGASDSMVPTFKYLDLIEICYAHVLLADGTLHNADYQGLMRIKVKDVETGESYVIPVMNTLLVPGLKSILWSVAGLSEQGHEVVFGFSTVMIKMHVNTERAFTIHLRHPLLTNDGMPSLPFAAPVIRDGLTIHEDREYVDQEDELFMEQDEEDSVHEVPPLMPPRRDIGDSDSDSDDDVDNGDARYDSTDNGRDQFDWQEMSDHDELMSEREQAKRDCILEQYDRYGRLHNRPRKVNQLDFEDVDVMDDFILRKVLTNPDDASYQEFRDKASDYYKDDPYFDIDQYCRDFQNGVVTPPFDDDVFQRRTPDHRRMVLANALTKIPENNSEFILNKDDNTDPKDYIIRPNRPTQRSTGMVMDSWDRQNQKDAKREWERAMGEYLVKIHYFQRRYGLLPGELPAYNPLDFPNARHSIALKPIDPRWWDHNYVSAEDDPLTKEVEVYLEAEKAYDAWNQADEILVRELFNKRVRIEFVSPPSTPETRHFPIVTQGANPRSRKRPVEMNLLRSRLGYRSVGALLTADKEDLWRDQRILVSQDEYCEVSQISQIRATPRGPAREPTEYVFPGQILYLDMQPNPAPIGLTPSSTFPQFLTILDQASRLFRLQGMKGSKTDDVISALMDFEQENRPYHNFTLEAICQEIHVDAGSQLISNQFRQWCRNRNISLVIAGPAHQEMNGLNERNWQTCRKMAFSLCNAARLGWPFLTQALLYASRIMDVLPAKGALKRSSHSGTGYEQSCPGLLWNAHLDQIKIARYRVFGCPVVFKVYKRKTPKDTEPRVNLDSKNLIQRGVRGIFVGFPTNQAGWRIYVPQVNRLITSVDVAFDEAFVSTGLAYDKILYADAMPTRGVGHDLNSTSRDFAYSGPPFGIRFTPYESEVDEPLPDVIYTDEMGAYDTYRYVGSTTTEQEDSSPADAIPAVVDKDNDNQEYDVEHIINFKYDKDGALLYEVKWVGYEETTWEPPDNLNEAALREGQALVEDLGGGKPSARPTVQEEQNIQQSADPMSDQGLRRSSRIRKRQRATAFATLVSRSLGDMSDDTRHACAASLTGDGDIEVEVDDVEIEPGEPGGDPTPFLDVPRSVTQTPYMNPKIGQAWVKAFVKEVLGILIQRQACALEDPLPGDPIVPLMEVYKCKINKDGFIDKLKNRIVYRGDLYNPADPQDSWNPHASFLALKVYLALCAKYGIFPLQVDFLLAYLQANMRERVFVLFPEVWKKWLPEHVHKWIGRPVLLKKALYGYQYSGKFLYQDQAEFLMTQGFEESGLPGFWFRKRNGALILLLHYVDDILIAGTVQRDLMEFVDTLKSRFDTEVRPTADWYLQTRLGQDKDKNVLLDQSRYSKSMVNRFLPNLPLEPTEKEKIKYASPVRVSMKFTRKDCSENKEEVEELEKEFGFRYIELAGCFNWLSYTCYEEIYAIRKLCKFMNLPGRQHFKAALHLLHHFRCHPPKPLIFYHDIQQAPVVKMLREVEGFDADPMYVIFADSAHADCDQGKSTACDLQVFQGGIIDHQSWVPNPIPLSTAESESNCYSAAIMRSRFPFKAIAKIIFDDTDRLYTVPVLVDSNAAIAMNNSDKPTKKTRHIESRYWYGRVMVQAGFAKLFKVDGATQQPADPGTKIMMDNETRYYRYLFEGSSLS